ncbi:MAG: hypothetical protein RI965_351 [Bacteroidota bacterium]|jgi:hypothetical protein
MLNKTQLKNVRTAAILTNAYVAGTTLTDCGAYNQLTLRINFTKGNLTDAQIKVEYSEDGTNWTQETFDSVSGGVNTLSAGVLKLSATGAYTEHINFIADQIKISAIGTDDVTSSSLKIDAILSIAS